ncbi:MAG: ATP-binding protein [Deltaproteobacteria bacterium]|nr:ATP-binding protein [Deltaproteobacteria bacterium]
MIHRILKLPESHSFFLFGARGTGKSSLLHERFSPEDAHWFDLLNPELADQLIAYPNRLIEMIEADPSKSWVVIDEIQKVPKLLDLVHLKIFEKKFHFALTGSSARKIKRGAANLLAGRAFILTLFPFTRKELGESFFDLNRALAFGTLPEAWLLDDIADRRRFLKSYALTYIKEEIIAEQVVRNLPPFRRFLEVAASCDTEIINYSNVAKDIHTDPKTVSNYYEILEDTLIAILLPSFHRSIRKRQKQAKKCYFFDPGISRVLSGQIDYELVPKSFEYGKLFEGFIVNEIYRNLTYAEKQFQLSFIRIGDNQEIDLVIERAGQPIFLCEIKASSSVDERDSKHLEVLGRDFENAVKLVISPDKVKKKFGTVMALPWPIAIDSILAGSL